MTDRQSRDRQSNDDQSGFDQSRADGGEKFSDPVAQALAAVRKATGQKPTGLQGLASGKKWRDRGRRRGNLRGDPNTPRSWNSGALPKPKGVPTRLDGRADRSYRDPGSFSQLLNREIRRQGWETNVGVRRIMQDWESLVGPKIASHTVPVKFDEEKRLIHVNCDATTWATQLHYLQEHILREITRQLGPDVVVELKIHNPNLGPRQKGRLRVRGRGPREDYG